jgi:capsular polysaccharide biosynthesis protein/transposase-like protein
VSSRGSYSPEFRREAVRRLRNGASSPRELAAELGCSVQTLQRWQRRLEIDHGSPAPEIESGAAEAAVPEAHAAVPSVAPRAALNGVIAREEAEPGPSAPDAIASEAPIEAEHPSEPLIEPSEQVEAPPEHEQRFEPIVVTGDEVEAAGPGDQTAPEPDPEPETEAEADLAAASSAPSIVDVFTRRWWVVVAITLIAALAAWAYASTVPPRYQATATVLAHPAVNVTKASDYSTDLSLLSYGSLEQTFVALARSSKLIDETTAGLGLGRAAGDHYHAVANVLPSSTVLEISVDGPDRAIVVPLANALGASVSKATRTYFPIFALTPLDAAVAPSSQIEPRTRQDVLFAGLAGLVLGVGVALLSLRVAAFSRLRVEGLGWPARF